MMKQTPSAIYTTESDYKITQLALTIAALEQQNLNLLALVEKKNEAWREANELFSLMYGINEKAPQSVVNVSEALALTADDVELVEYARVQANEIDIEWAPGSPYLACGTKLYGIKMKGK